MGLGLGLNLLLLLAMVATNILSLYHLSSTQYQRLPPPAPVPDQLVKQLNTIRATINHLTGVRSTATTGARSTSPPPDLLLYSRLYAIATACHDHPDLLHRYMNYTPFTLCPSDHQLSENLIHLGCHPLPRRRCFSPTISKLPSSLPTNPFPSSLPESALLFAPYTCKSFKCFDPKLGFNMKLESTKFLTPKSDLDITTSQILRYSLDTSSPLRLALDVGGGTGTFAAIMKRHNVTVVTSTMNLGAPYNEVTALRGLIPLHVPLQQRFPIFDGTMDLVRCGHAVNRWIPTVAMEFLFYDVDRVLRAGGFLWLDHFFSKSIDLQKIYGPLIGKLGYKKLRWAIGNKTDASGLKNGEVYLTALLQKPTSK